MMTLFDDEQILKAYTKDIEEKTARETVRETARKTEREIAERMIKDGEMSLEKIARYVTTLSLDELKEIESKVMQLA